MVSQFSLSLLSSGKLSTGITGWFGTLNEYSLYTDYHFTKRFEVYAGIAYSEVTGDLEIAIPHGPGVPYYYNNNIAPTVGVRYTF